jgi:hypothetical protein
MPRLDIILDGDGAFADVPAEKLAHTTEPIRIAGLAGGMIGGDGRRNPSVAIGVFLPHNGGCVLAETSLKLFLTAADALKARYGDPR